MKVKQTVQAATAAIAMFFAAKMASGLFLLKLSSTMLSVTGFGVFSQFLLAGALTTTIAVAGAQNGVVRQVATSDQNVIDRSMAAAGLLWVVASSILIAVSLLFSEGLSLALTGQRNFAQIVPLVVGAATLSGPGQIACAVLTGLGRTKGSLAAQAAGLIAGTAMASFLLASGTPEFAAFGYYAGSLVTVPLGIYLVRRSAVLRLPEVSEIIAEVPVLLRYSAGLVAVTSSTALLLFGLRYFYLSAFGAEALGYWLVAQRISDTSTQLLGLFMIQYFVPAFGASNGDDRRAVMRDSFLIGTGAMLLLLAVFIAGSRLWVHLLLSDSYIPAIGMIMIYMTGDVFRATSSLAMYAALTESKVMQYALIDTLAVALMAAITLLLIANNVERAPGLGYACGYAIVALFFGTRMLARWRGFRTKAQGPDSGLT